MIATVAFAGIEAAANLAPEVRGAPALDLRKLVIASATLVPLVYVGVSVVALMALPVVADPGRPADGARDDLPRGPGARAWSSSFDPAWVSDLMQAAVVLIVPAALFWAANTAMLGLSRHVYVLATNRQIPSWLGKLNRRSQTPHVAIIAAAVIAIGLILPTDVALLGGLFAFGATIAFTIAHAVGHPDADHRARSRAAVPDPARRHDPRRPGAAADDHRGGAHRRSPGSA